MPWPGAACGAGFGSPAIFGNSEAALAGLWVRFPGEIWGSAPSGRFGTVVEKISCPDDPVPVFSARFEKPGVVRPAPVWGELLVVGLLADAEDARVPDPDPDPLLDFPPVLTGEWAVPPPVDPPPEPAVPPPEPVVPPPEPVVPPPEPVEPPPEPVVPPPEPVDPPPEPVDPPPEPVDPPPEPLVFVGDGLGDGDGFVGAGAGVQVGVAVGAGVGLFVGAGVHVGVLAADAGPLSLIRVKAVSASTTAARISALAIESPIGRRFRITRVALLPGPGGWLVTRCRHII